MGKEGKSQATMASELGIGKSAFFSYIQDYPEFSDAVKQAIYHSQAWWEENGRLATFGGHEGFNATSFIFNMKNRFKEDWRDKVEQEHTGTLQHEHSVSESDREILNRFKQQGDK